MLIYNAAWQALGAILVTSAILLSIAGLMGFRLEDQENDE